MSVARLVEDKDIQSVEQSALLAYTLNSNSRVDALAATYGDYYKDFLSKSIGVKALENYNWAKNKYIYGVPTAMAVDEGRASISAAMTQYLKPSSILYANLGPINNMHASFQMLVDKYGYSFDSNTLRYSNTEYYLHDIEILYCSGSIQNAVAIDYFNPMGYSPRTGETPFRSKNSDKAFTDWVEDTSISHDTAKVTLVRENVDGDPEYKTITLDFLAYEHSGNEPIGAMGDGTNDTYEFKGESDYFMCQYLDASGSRKIFTYEYLSGGVPYLDNVVIGDIVSGKYLPQLYLRINGVKANEGEYATKPENADSHFKSSKNLANRINLDYSGLVDELHESLDDLQYIKDIILTNRLPANTKDPLIMEYMFNFFMEEYRNSASVRQRSDSLELTYDMIQEASVKGRSLHIADSKSSYSLTMKGIGYRDVSGNIGEVGTFTSGVSTKDVLGFAGGRVTSVTNWGQSYHYYRKQVTPNTYREVKVYGLSMTQDLIGGGSTTHSGEDEELLIPLDVEVVRKRMVKVKDALTAKSLHFVFTTSKTVKTKWYQRGAFAVLITIVGIVISVVTAGAGTPLLIAIVKAIVITVVISVVATVAAKILTSLGVDAQLVGAVVAVVAVIAGGYALGAKTSVAGLKATQIMMVANTAFAVSNNGAVLNMQAMQKAYDSYVDVMESEMEKIDTLRKETGLDDANIDVFTLLASPIAGPDIRIGETPISFYERTLAVNTGILTNTIVNNFVYLTTQLPTFESLMQERR